MTGHPSRRSVAALAVATLMATLAGSALAAEDGVEPTKVKHVVRCAGMVATKVGTAGNDRIVGTAGRDIIAGLGGNDVILGRGGNDVICGGAGNDRIAGGAGHDRIYGQTGRDRLFGQAGVDRLLGGQQNDFLAGQTGPDVLAGGAGSDKLDGGSGVDACYQDLGHGPLVRCELPKSPFSGPTLHDLTRVHAIAYSDVDGLDGYSTGDVMIAQLVDTQADGVPGLGDTVVMGRYPTNLMATAFGDWGVHEHVVAEISVGPNRIVAYAANGSHFLWEQSDGPYIGESYREGRHIVSDGETRLQDEVEGGPLDWIHLERTSPSQPLAGPLSLLGDTPGATTFMDVMIVYQAS